MANRVFVYVDGFNLYYRALKGSDFKWLDIEAFASQFLSGAQRVEKVRYFTARVSGRSDTDAPRRQEAYLKALGTMPDVEIHYGNFLSKIGEKPRVTANGKVGPMVKVHLTEEKGSDVNLGVHLVNDAHLDSFDVALVLSQDSDLLEPIRMVNAMGKPTGIIWLQPKTKSKSDKFRAPSKPFHDAAHFIKYSRKSHYRQAQFENEVYDQNGDVISVKPKEW